LKLIAVRGDSDKLNDRLGNMPGYSSKVNGDEQFQEEFITVQDKAEENDR